MSVCPSLFWVLMMGPCKQLLLIHEWDKYRELIICLAFLQHHPLFPLPLLFHSLAEKVLCGRWVQNLLQEVRGLKDHGIRKSHLVLLGEGWGERKLLSMGLLGNGTLPFRVAQRRWKYLWSTIVVGIFCYSSGSSSLGPDGGCDGIGGDEKLAVGGKGRK